MPSTRGGSIANYPDTPLGKAAERVGGWNNLAYAMEQLEQRGREREASSLMRMASGEYAVSEAVAIAAERVSKMPVASQYFPWLSGIRIRKAA